VSIARALAKVPGAQPVPHLIRLLRAPEEWLWREALVGLARPEAHAAVPVLTDLLARKQPVSFLVGAIGRVMVAVGDPDGVAAVLTAAEDPRLGYGLPDLVSAIPEWPDPRVDAFLLAHLRDFEIEVRPPQDGPPKKREINRKVAVALAKRGNDAGIQRLLEMLEQEQQAKISGQTVVALGEVGDERAVPALTSLLGADPRRMDSHVLRKIVEALVKIRDERAIQPLINFVRVAGHWELVDVVARWDHPAIRAMLLAALNEKQYKPMCAAALALHKQGVRQGVDRLLAVLGDEIAAGCSRWHRFERYMLYRALGDMNDPRVIPALIAAVAADRHARGEAALALRKITGVDLPADADAWQRWWQEAARGRR